MPAQKTIVRSVRFSPEEWQILRLKARSANLPVTTFIRRAALRREIQHRTTPAAIKAVNRVGVNLNQLTRVANATGRIPPKLQETLEAVDDTLERLLE